MDQWGRVHLLLVRLSPKDLEVAAVAIADRLVQMVTEVTPINRRMMRIFYTQGVVSHVCLCML